MSLEKKISRNDPCPCASGKKYKKCCLSKENVTQAKTDDTATAATESGSHEKKVVKRANRKDSKGFNKASMQKKKQTSYRRPPTSSGK